MHECDTCGRDDLELVEVRRGVYFCHKHLPLFEREHVVDPNREPPGFEVNCKAVFKDLPIGANFRFFERGSLLTKTSERGYSASQWDQTDNRVLNLNQAVIPVNLSPHVVISVQHHE